MKKRALLVLILLGLLAFIVWRLWFVRASQQSASIIQPTTVSAGQIVLVEASGTVEIEAPDRQQWETATSGMELLSGTHVRTGEHSEAIVQVFDQSENRLGENTEITVNATLPTIDHRGAEIGFSVATGRLWSRVLGLLDLRDHYSVQTSDVIATVRGTAFSVEKTATSSQLFVMHGVLDTVSGYLPDRWVWNFAKDSVSGKGIVSDAGFNDPWVITNRVKDEQYTGARVLKEPPVNTSADRVYADFFVIDQQFNAIFQSEALLPAVTAETMDNLQSLVGDADQRLRDLPANTDKLDREALTRKAAAMRARFDALQEEQAKLTIKTDTNIQPAPPVLAPKPASSVVTPVKPIYPTPAKRLSCSSLLVTAQPASPRVGERVSLLVQALQNDLRYLDVTKNAAFSVTDKVATLQGNILTMTREGSTYVEAHVTCDGQVMVGRTMIKTAPVAATLQSLEVSANPSVLVSGERSQLAAYAVYSDGSQKDVSYNATFTLADAAFGSMSGRVFTASGRKTGVTTINVSFNENGKAVSQAVQITINPPSTATYNLLQ